jgi:aminopeptidase-like protein
MKNIGKKIYQLCKVLFPINRSITGDGVRKTLDIIKEQLPHLVLHEVPTGTKCFDWIIPKEWNISDAYIIDPNGNKVVDFKENNLHVVGYSKSIDCIMDLEQLNDHLYSIPSNPAAVPYITSYYKETWGFCVSHNQRKKMVSGKYKVYIDSTLSDGSLTYAELLIPGEIKDEIFLSTYMCHPSMANNELSGPALTTFLAEYIQKIKKTRYSYRIIFIPETIGSIMYLSKHLKYLKENVVAGFNITCVGDNNTYSYLPSRRENSLSDKVALHVLEHSPLEYKKYSFLERGSDERQYCSPGIDLPICSVMRTKYAEYEEYHTSLDNLYYISGDGLSGAYDVYKKMIDLLENNYTYKCNILCEPQLGKRGLYPTTSTKETHEIVADQMNFLAYCDGSLDLIDIANIIKTPAWNLYDIINKFLEHGIISRVR